MKHCVAILIYLLAMEADLTWAQRDFAQVEIKVTPVSGHIYMLEGTSTDPAVSAGPVGNIAASVGPDGILIVDDQFAPLAEKIQTALKGLGGGPLKFILNTHWHGDHTDGNKIFGPQAPIIAHTNVRRRLMTEQKIVDRVFPPAPPEAWPVITFDTSLSLHFNGEEIKVVHFPQGHTDGDSVIFFTGSNVVHMGDQFFAGRFPFVDLDSGGDVEGLTKNIEAVMRQLPADVKIIPGHGPLSTLDDLRTYRRMLVETTNIVRERIEGGQSLDAIKAKGLPEEWKSFAGGPISTELWIEILYRSLSR